MSILSMFPVDSQAVVGGQLNIYTQTEEPQNVSEGIWIKSDAVNRVILGKAVASDTTLIPQLFGFEPQGRNSVKIYNGKIYAAQLECMYEAKSYVYQPNSEQRYTYYYTIITAYISLFEHSPQNNVTRQIAYAAVGSYPSMDHGVTTAVPNINTKLLKASVCLDIIDNKFYVAFLSSCQVAISATNQYSYCVDMHGARVFDYRNENLTISTHLNNLFFTNKTYAGSTAQPQYGVVNYRQVLLTNGSSYDVECAVESFIMPNGRLRYLFQTRSNTYPPDSGSSASINAKYVEVNLNNNTYEELVMPPNVFTRQGAALIPINESNIRIVGGRNMTTRQLSTAIDNYNIVSGIFTNRIETLPVPSYGPGASYVLGTWYLIDANYIATYSIVDGVIQQVGNTNLNDLISPSTWAWDNELYIAWNPVLKLKLYSENYPVGTAIINTDMQKAKLVNIMNSETAQFSVGIDSVLYQHATGLSQIPAAIKINGSDWEEV